MKINFTKKEYRALVEMLEMANWITTSHKVDPNEQPKKYNDLTEKVYSFAEKMDCTDILEFNENMDRHFVTQEFEDNSDTRDLIVSFEEDSFWAELIHRLAERDVVNKFKVENIYEIDLDARFEALSDAEEKWADEFTKFGLNRLVTNAVVSLENKNIH